MSLQERIKKTVQLEEPDRVPVGILSSASTTQVFTKMSAEDFFSGPEKMLESEVKSLK
jgi:uroporphyrinogen-III decarboxylase